MKLLMPPTWTELLDNQVYRTYVKKRPRLPVNVSHGFPWLVVARRPESATRPTWGLKMMGDYADAYYRVRDILAAGEFEDAAIISRRKLFAPPTGFRWNRSKFSWCGRCRRPSMFTNTTRHHALRNAPALATEDANRCHFCGAREIFAARFSPR